MILEALVNLDFDVKSTAEVLGVSRPTIYNKLKTWKLPPPLGGQPETVKYSEFVRRCDQIKAALELCKQLKIQRVSK